jgi:hypothetical protein
MRIFSYISHENSMQRWYLGAKIKRWPFPGKIRDGQGKNYPVLVVRTTMR